MIEYAPIITLLSPTLHGQPCLLNALDGGAIDGRGVFKTDEAAARIEGLWQSLLYLVFFVLTFPLFSDTIILALGLLEC